MVYYHLFQEGKPRSEKPYDFTLFHEDELNDEAVKKIKAGDGKIMNIPLGGGRMHILKNSKATARDTAELLGALQSRADETDEALRVLIRKHVNMKGEIEFEKRHNEVMNAHLLKIQDEKTAAVNSLLDKEAELASTIEEKEAAVNALSKEVAARETADKALNDQAVELAATIEEKEAAVNALSKEVAARETADKEAELSKEMDQVAGRLYKLGGAKEFAEEEETVGEPPVDRLAELDESEDKEEEITKEEESLNTVSDTTVGLLNADVQFPSPSGSFGITITDMLALLLPLFGGPNNRTEDPFAAQNAGQELALLCSGVRSQEELLKLPNTVSFRNFRTRFCKAQGILGENGFRVFEQNKDELVTLKSKLWLVQKDKGNTEASLEWYKKKFQQCDCDLKAKQVAERSRQIISDDQERRAFKRKRMEDMEQWVVEHDQRSGRRNSKRQKGEIDPRNSGREGKARR